MENNHQVAPNSARQIRKVEHYKFKNACQFCYSWRGLLAIEIGKNTANSLDWTVIGVVATGQDQGAGELFGLR